MTPIDSILGIHGLVVHCDKRAHDIHVWAKLRKRGAGPHYAGQQIRIKVTRQRTVKHTRQGNQFMVLHPSAAKCTTAPIAIVIFATSSPASVHAFVPPKRIVWRSWRSAAGVV